MGQSISKSSAGKLAASVAVQDHSGSRLKLAGRFKRLNAQFFLPIVVHSEANDFTVVTIQNRSNVQFTVPAWNLGNIGQPLPSGNEDGAVKPS